MLILVEKHPSSPWICHFASRARYQTFEMSKAYLDLLWLSDTWILVTISPSLFGVRILHLGLSKDLQQIEFLVLFFWPWVFLIHRYFGFDDLSPGLYFWVSIHVLHKIFLHSDFDRLSRSFGMLPVFTSTI